MSPFHGATNTIFLTAIRVVALSVVCSTLYTPAARAQFTPVSHVRSQGSKDATRLLWGTTSQTARRSIKQSAFSEVRTVSAIEPVTDDHEPLVPDLFPVFEPEQTKAARDEELRRMALARSKAYSQRQAKIAQVAAEEAIGRQEFVAGRIPTSSNPFGDAVARQPSVTAIDNPHVDPFGDHAVPTLSPSLPEISPAPMAPPVLTPISTPTPTPSPVYIAPKSLSINSPMDTTPVAPPVVATPVPVDLPKPIGTPEPIAAPTPVAPPAVQHEVQQPVLKPSSRSIIEKSPARQRILTQAPPAPALDAPAPRSLESFVRPPANTDQNPSLKEDAADVPEFPEYKEKEKPPATDELPDVEEPPRPEGDDEAGDDDDLLNFPGDDDSEAGEDDSEDDEDSEDDDDEEDENDDDEEDEETLRCRRTYNERNCCEQDGTCRTTFEKLQESRIQDFSVSITPPLVPLAEDETEVEEQRERLAKSPVRNWTNRNGSIVATGRLVDFKDESIIVESTGGGRVTIPYFQVGHDDLCFLTAWWRLPGECLLAGDDRAIRDFRMTTFTWKASAVCHKPLYFEEVQLERYGHSAGPILQPLLSGAHFISNIQLLPYNMGVYPPTECRYALGHYRPGSCAPWLIPAFPLSHRGVAWELGAAFGLWGIF